MNWRDATVAALTLAALGPIAYLTALGAFWTFINADAEGLEPTNQIAELDREDGGPGPIAQELNEVPPMATHYPRPLKLVPKPPEEPPPKRSRLALWLTRAVLVIFIALMVWAVWP